MFVMDGVCLEIALIDPCHWHRASPPTLLSPCLSEGSKAEFERVRKRKEKALVRGLKMHDSADGKIDWRWKNGWKQTGR